MKSIHAQLHAWRKRPSSRNTTSAASKTGMPSIKPFFVFALNIRNSSKDIDIKVLQEKLAGEDIIIHFDEALVPADVNKVEEAELEHI